MEIGQIGVDIVSVSRFRNLDENSAFFTKVLRESEIAYCTQKPNPAESFAGLFAAKEAVRKALVASSVDYQAIEITHTPQGVPTCRVEEWSDRYSIHISISHTQDNAVGMCVVSLQDK